MNALPPTPPPAASGPGISSDEVRTRSWNMWCHLSVLAGLLIPLGTLLGPLLIWQIKQHEVPSVIQHGKAALNFQLTVLLATIVLAIAAFLLSFIFIGLLLLPLVFLLPLAGLVLSIIAGVKANDGREFKYPFTLNLIA